VAGKRTFGPTDAWDIARRSARQCR